MVCRGRPRGLPWAARLASPARTRSTILARSNSAIAAEDMHLQLAGGRRGVDAFGQRDERDAESLQLVEQRDQVLQAPSETIEPPADQHIEPAALGIGQKLVERGATILRPADAVIDVLDRGPAAGLDVAPQLCSWFSGSWSSVLTRA